MSAASALPPSTILLRFAIGFLDLDLDPRPLPPNPAPRGVRSLKEWARDEGGEGGGGRCGE
eukprot:8278611-Pyramimonas_sp.AAC.1